MGLIDQLRRGFMINAWQRHLQSDVEPKAAFRPRANADGGGHAGIVWNLDLQAFRMGGDEFHRAQETGSIAGREHLLGVVTVATVAAKFLRGGTG